MRLTKPRAVSVASVCVVDPRPADHAALGESARPRPARLRFLPRGRDAMQLKCGEGEYLWIINTALPDMSGLDLCAMLKASRPHSTVYMVTDAYSILTERAAWVHGATLFSVKPACPTWLDCWCLTRTIDSTAWQHPGSKDLITNQFLATAGHGKWAVACNVAVSSTRPPMKAS